MDKGPHSAAQFTNSRDFWWNADYLDLIGHRFNLAASRRILELGAGVGHWTEIVLRQCHPEAELIALEREPQWIKSLEERFGDRQRVRPLEFDVTHLHDFEGGFDLVTCQKLLLHLTNVEEALKQTKRLLVPGGLLLVAEPDNLRNRLMATPSSCLTPIDYGALSALWWAYDIGREREGLGREWIAEELPGLMARVGFIDITVSQNDKAWPRFAPYDDPEQIAIYGVADCSLNAESDSETEASVRRFALAGGLDETAIAHGWSVCNALHRATVTAVKEGVFSTCGPGNLFLFGARRPTTD